MITNESYSIGEAIKLGVVDAEDTSIVASSVRIVPKEDNGESCGVIKIGKNARIREGCVICSGVVIGNNSIIGHMVILRKNVHVGSNTVISHLTNIERDTVIGNNVRVSSLTHLTGSCIVEDDVQIGARVATVNDNRLVWRKNPVLVAPIFRKMCSIGSGVTILGGVEIGENSLIGAGAVVTRSIPSNVVAYGVPAYVQKDRHSD